MLNQAGRLGLLHSGVALLSSVCSVVLAIGARVHWGFGDTLFPGLMLLWIAVCCVCPVVIARSRLVSRAPLRFAGFFGATVWGAYLVAGYPVYFTRNAYYSMGAILAWVLLCAGLAVASGLAAGAMALVAHGGVFGLVRRAAALTLALGLAEVAFTRVIESGYAITYFAGGPPFPIPVVAGAAIFEAAMTVLCVGAFAVLASAAWLARRARG